MGRTLLGRVDRDLPTRCPEGGTGRLDRQAGMVALLAQVEQDQMLHGDASRPRQDRLH